MIGININISGDMEFMAKLAKLPIELLDFKEALNETGKELKAYFGGQAFESQGGVFGTPWKALAGSTQAQKAKHYRQYAAVPLMRTGDMKKGFTYKAGATHLEVTNKMDYFKYHQSTESRHKIPRRPMMGINKDVKNIIRKAFYKAMIAKMAGL